MAEKRLVVTVEGKNLLTPKLKQVSADITDMGQRASKLEDIQKVSSINSIYPLVSDSRTL